MNRVLLVSATALVLATWSASAIAAQGYETGAAEPKATQRETMPTDAAAFMSKAGASDLYEIESSRLALEKSQRDDVRRFAQMMINDHTNTTQQLTAAAQAAGMSPPPPKLTPKQAGMIDKLRGASASAFDSTYLAQQTGAHDKALKLHQNMHRTAIRRH